MKKIVTVGLVLLILSCKKQGEENFNKHTIQNSEKVSSEGMPSESETPEQLGEKIFNGKGNCVACHQIDQKTVGPSLQEIAKIYKDKKGDIVSFLKGQSEPIVDPSQFEVMKPNFAVTEEMSDEKLHALEAYIYSNLN